MRASSLARSGAAGAPVPAPGRLRQPATARRHPPTHLAPVRQIVSRSRLVAALVQCRQRLAVIVAPAGWGKSTLLAQWRRAEPRPFVLVRLPAQEKDPGALLDALGTALAVLAAPAGEREPPRSLEDVIRVVSGLPPSVLAFDGTGDLRADAVRAVVAEVVAHVPDRSTVVIASRHEPGLPLGRRRAEDDLIEIRAERLAMTRSESADLLRATLPALTDRHADQLFELTAGWPAALRLAASVVRDEGAGAIATFGGADTVVGEYVREEVLAGLDGDDRAFLRGASILPQLTGAACDTAVGADDSAARLRRLVEAGVPLAPVDRIASAYRLNPLLAQALRAELRRVEPQLEPRLHRRLSAWHERAGDATAAIEHAVQARDLDRAGGLLAARAAALVAQGDGDRVATWVSQIGAEEAQRHPGIAMAAGIAAVARGEGDAVEHWAATALQATGAAGGADPPAAVRAGALLARALGGCHGAEQMAADARRAAAAVPGHGPWSALASFAGGTAQCLSRNPEPAAAQLAACARTAVLCAPLIRSLSLAELAFLALEREDASEAGELAALARSALDGTTGRGGAFAALTFAVGALVHAQQGRPDEAAADLAQASSRLGALRAPPPWYGAFVRVAMARAHLKLSEPGAARAALAEAARLRRLVAGAAALEAWLDATWALADDYAAGPVACPSSLTIAELRVLRLLPSHLTFREIGARLHVSANTVKTQAHSVYRKLDARSRSEAVAHAGALGLVDLR